MQVLETSDKTEDELGIVLNKELKPVAEYIFEFLELLVKPMVNTFVTDPRLSVTVEIMRFIKETSLPKLAI